MRYPWHATYHFRQFFPTITMEISTFYRVCFFYVQKLILNKNLSKLRYRGLTFCILLCEVCVFVTCILLTCGIPGFLVLYSRTKVLKLMKIAKMFLKRPQLFDDFVPIIMNDTKFWKLNLMSDSLRFFWYLTLDIKVICHQIPLINVSLVSQGK